MMGYILNKMKRLSRKVDTRDNVTARTEPMETSLAPPASPFQLEEEDGDNVSAASSKIEDYIPVDHGRWKPSKTAEQARAALLQTLKDLHIARFDDNWAKWDGFFRTLVHSLELPAYIFGDTPLPAPMTHADLIRTYANGNSEKYTEIMVPGLFQDPVLGRVYHNREDLKGVEIIHEEEKRRFDAAMVLHFSIITSCTVSSRLEGIMQ